jgi:hypothetical protein
MAAAAERLIETATSKRDALLHAAERIDAEMDACRRNLEIARGDLKQTQLAAALAERETPYIRSAVLECEASYERWRAERDRLYVLQGTAWAELDRFDAAHAAASGVPYISIYDNPTRN